MTADLVPHLPQSLRIIVSSSVGYDHFDTRALAARSPPILFCNTPGTGAAAPVADHALLLTLSLYRQQPAFERVLALSGDMAAARALLTSGRPWDASAGRPLLADLKYRDDSKHHILEVSASFGDRVGDRPVEEPRGHTVAVLGFGPIGRAIGARLSAIGMHVCYYSRNPAPASVTEKLGYHAKHYSRLADILPRAQLVVAALPLTPQTRHLLNDDTLALLPQGARVINVGRGATVDSAALLRALRSGRIHGAGLDVIEGEPQIEPGLLDRWDVIITPHIGSSTRQNAIQAQGVCMTNITAFFENRIDSVKAVNKEFF